MRNEINAVDLAFVVDTTGSMSGLIAAAQDQMVRMLREVTQAADINLWLGVVEYRDHPPQDTMVSRVHAFTEDLQKAQRTILRLEAQGGGDGPEAVLDGIVAGCNELGWWRHSRRLMVLVGDAPPHGVGASGDAFGQGCPCGETIASVTRMAEERRVTIHSLGLTSAANEAFREISYLTGGQFFSAQEAKKAIEHIATLLKAEFADLDVDRRVLALRRDSPDRTIAEEQPDFRTLPLVYTHPDMRATTRLRDITYKTLEDGSELKLDVYYPDTYDGQTLLPTVLFVHGDGPPELLQNAKDWACYIGWGELVATTGLAAVTFNHRSTEMLQKVYESAADVDDLITYVRDHSHDLGIDPERLAIWTCSAGSYRGLHAALHGSPPYIRCAVSYYGVVDLKVFLAWSDDEQESQVPKPGVETFAEFAVATFLRQNASLPPLFFARAGLDDPALNASIDELVRVALERNCSFDLLNHATGHHGFDIMDDNKRSREIIRATLEFLKTHLLRDA